MASALPLYGTCSSLTPASMLKSSPPRCEPLPRPAEPKVIWPGFAFASAIRSLTDLTGSDGCTISAPGAMVSRVIGAKSLIVSNGSFFVQRRRHRHVGAEKIQRVAIGRRARGDFGSDHAATAGPVVDYHLLAERLAELVADHARRRIVAAAGR